MHGSKKKKRTSRHDHNAFTYNLHHSVKTVNNTQLKVSQTGKSDKSREVGGFSVVIFVVGSRSVRSRLFFLLFISQRSERSQWAARLKVSRSEPAKPVGSQT